ncbi:MAG: hypothetical protein ABF807_06485 [Liquorilactobacillus nagelii]|uniref:hypothetical protein n=1 Tax=Liquorilactobacillus nagelii TaxID=82688 RepID=UPI0039E9CFCB
MKKNTSKEEFNFSLEDAAFEASDLSLVISAMKSFFDTNCSSTNIEKDDLSRLAALIRTVDKKAFNYANAMEKLNLKGADLND